MHLPSTDYHVTSGHAERKKKTRKNINILKTTKVAYDTVCSAIPTHCLCVRALVYRLISVLIYTVVFWVMMLYSKSAEIRVTKSAGRLNSVKRRLIFAELAPRQLSSI